MKGAWRVFNDGVHGHMALHPLCVLVMDTPQFQRLRHLSQLGGTYYVFPSASHKRFEHSLGVAYLAEQLVSTLQRNQPELGISPVDVACVSLAGLCHDLGHGPFSHLWERFMHEARPQRRWKHEESSVLMFRHLVAENRLMEQFRAAGLDDRDMVFIEEQIAGPCDGRQYCGRTGDKVFLYEIISNKRNGIDVDKWDYFCRDSAALGITISFDYKRCLLYSRVIKVNGDDYQICTRDKEAGNMYDLFYTRWVLHRRAYQHRVARIVERMIVDILLLAEPHMTLPNPAACSDDNTATTTTATAIIDSATTTTAITDSATSSSSSSSSNSNSAVGGGSGGGSCGGVGGCGGSCGAGGGGVHRAAVRLSEAVDFPAVFTNLTDHVLQLIAGSSCRQLAAARQLLRRLHTRQLYRFIGSTQALDQCASQIDTEQVRRSLGAMFSPQVDGVGVDDLIVELVSVSYGMDDKNPIDCVRFYSKCQPDTAQLVRQSAVSALLPTRFRETFIMALCRVRDGDKVTLAAQRFELWCRRNHYTCPSREFWFDHISPLKDEKLSNVETDDAKSQPL